MIILKIFIKISSRKAIHYKILPKSEVLERILVRIFFKDYVCGGWITDYFLRSNILKKISSKDLPMVCFVVTQHSESERFR